MQFVERYQLKAGIFIALFVSFVTFIPRAIRYETNMYFPLFIQVAGISFLYALCTWLVSQFLIRDSNIRLQWIKATIAILFSIVISAITAQNSSSGMEAIAPLLSISSLSEERRILMILFRGVLIGGFVYVCAYYLNMLLDTQQAKIEMEHLKQENLEARLNSLKQQVSPHFLFNSLNTLKSLSDEENVKDYVVQLSNVYRYLLNYNENNLATVKEELAFINAYSFILKERFEDGFSMQITIRDSIMDMHIPPLSLQILIENAVKHNIASQSKPLNITIRDDVGYIIISNNLQRKISSEETTGKGLHNISDRYRLLAQKTIEIKDDGINFYSKITAVIMINVLIIEDEVKAARELKKLLEQLRDDMQVIDILQSVEEAVEWFGKHPQPGLIISDIQLADGLSFDFFSKNSSESPRHLLYCI